MRKWNITIFLVNDKGQDVAADIFEKVTYELHPSFENRAKQGILSDIERDYEALRWPFKR
jgi:transcription initiation factor IIF auxiliary subunit